MSELRKDVKPLTRAETNWIFRLEKTLRACPSKRLELVTIGDSSLTVIDGQIALKHDLDLHDGGCDRNGIALAFVMGKPLIHGVSG